MAKKYNDFGFMQWFYDLTTMKKMMVLIVVIAVSMVVVGYTGLYFNKKANESASIIFNNNLKPIRLINIARVNLNANRTNLYHAIAVIGYDRNGVNQYLADIPVRAKKIDKDLDAFESLMKELNDEYTLKEMESLKSSLNKYRAGREVAIQAIKKGQKVQAIKLAESQRDTAFEVVSHVSNIAAHIQKRAEKRNAKTLEDAKSAESYIIISIVCALLLSIFLAYITADRIAGVLGALGEKMQAVAGGDLKVEEMGRPEKSCIGDLCVVFDQMNAILKKLDTFIKDTAIAVEEIASGSQEMTANAEQVAEGAQQVASSIEQVAAGAQQVSTNVEQLAAGAQGQSKNANQSLENVNKINIAVTEILKETEETAALSKDTEQNAAGGYKLSQDAVLKINEIKKVSNEISGTINELGQLSNNIEEIVDLIKGIASQTNLLALNAAIEAARAGEHGKGFAVVAEEVKALAGESANATDKITEMIKVIQSKTSDAVNIMDTAIQEVDSGVNIVSNVGSSLEEIVKAAKETNGNVDIITNAVNQLAENSNNVVQLMEDLAATAEESTASAEDISSVTEETAASVEEVSSTTEEQTASIQEISAKAQTLSKVVENLNAQLLQFKV